MATNRYAIPLRNDAYKIFKQKFFDMRNPFQFSFNLRQLKQLLSWASPNGKSKLYLKLHPYRVPRHDVTLLNNNQTQYKASLVKRLKAYLNDERVQKLSDDRKINMRYLLNNKNIEAFQTLLQWSSYFKKGETTSKGDLKKMYAEYLGIKDKYPPISLSDDYAVNNQKLLDNMLANVYADFSHGDENEPIDNYGAHYILNEELKRLRNRNFFAESWARYKRREDERLNLRARQAAIKSQKKDLALEKAKIEKQYTEAKQAEMRQQIEKLQKEGDAAKGLSSTASNPSGANTTTQYENSQPIEVTPGSATDFNVTQT
ncbi:MAG: hypothetical protein WCJ58_02200 [bacterium]